MLLKVAAGLSVILYAIVLVWISVKHSLRTTCRQVFIFHPWCDAGGGGEKCLWLAVKEFAERARRDMERSTTYQSSGGRTRYKKPLRLSILCHATAPHIQDLLNDVDRNFGIKISSAHAPLDKERCRDSTKLSEYVTLKLVRLHTASLAVKVYPLATQFVQMAAGLLVAYEAALKTRGNRYDLIWDTTGLATTIAWYNWLTSMMRRRCYVYVHYPFLRALAPDAPVSVARAVYSALIGLCYFAAGACYRQPILVNSTFTQEGLRALWPRRKLLKVLPPVDTALEARAGAAPVVISIAQFRREKRHLFQIEVIARLLKSGRLPAGTVFLICGSCRPRSSAHDDSLVLEVLRYADEICGNSARIELHCHSKLDWIKWAPSRFLPAAEVTIEFHINSGTKQLRSMMAGASVGLHTMVDEHLGISVAEMALAGLFVVAHNSAGPRYDILAPPTEPEWVAVLGDGAPPFRPDLGPLGALCDSAEDFVDQIAVALRNGPEVVERRRLAARFIRARFPTSPQFAREVLDNWGLYTKQ